MLLAFKKHVTVSGSRVTGNHDAARASMGGEILVGEDCHSLLQRSFPSLDVYKFFKSYSF